MSNFIVFEKYHKKMQKTLKKYFMYHLKDLSPLKKCFISSSYTYELPSKQS